MAISNSKTASIRNINHKISVWSLIAIEFKLTFKTRNGKASSKLAILVLIQGLCFLGCQSQEQKIQQFIVQLSDRNHMARARAIYTLSKIGEPAIPALINALDNEDTRQSAADILSRIGVPAIPALIRSANHADRGTSVSIINALIKIGKPAVSSLIGMLNHEDIWIRNVTVAALTEIGEPSVSELIEALHHQDNLVQINVAVTLGDIGKPALPALIEALDGSTITIRLKIIMALNRINSFKAKSSVMRQIPILIEALNDEMNIRIHTVEVLGLIGTAAKPAIPSLIGMLNDSDERLCASVVLALGRIGNPNQELVSVLIRILKNDKRTTVQNAITQALELFGKSAGSAVPALIEILNVSDKKNQSRIVLALDNIGTLEARKAAQEWRVRQTRDPR